MNLTEKPTTWSAARCVLPLLWVAAAMFVPAGALAQANACDQLKGRLAARIEASGVRGYTLETVPAGTPVPAGAKAIGKCEGGERKILYRRWGAAPPSARADSAVAPASAPQVTVLPEPPPRRPPPVVRANVPAPVVPVPPPPPPPAVNSEPAKPRLDRAREVDVVRMADPLVVPAAQPRPPEPAAEKPPLSQPVSEFVATNWRWLLALLLVPLAACGWAWRAHHLAYDKNGLPRGPRL